jgi:hypothetical protein
MDIGRPKIFVSVSRLPAVRAGQWSATLVRWHWARMPRQLSGVPVANRADGEPQLSCNPSRTQAGLIAQS